MLPEKMRAVIEAENVKQAIDKKGAPIAGGLMAAATAPLWFPYADRMM